VNNNIYKDHARKPRKRNLESRRKSLWEWAISFLNLLGTSDDDDDDDDDDDG